METTIKQTRIPQTDSIEELAKFWDTHDVTDFEDELEEVTESIFARSITAIVYERIPTELIHNQAKQDLRKTDSPLETFRVS